MTRYFVAANVWLIFGVLTILGRGHSTMGSSSFFIGPLIDDPTYNYIERALFVFSAYYFFLTLITGKKS